MGGVTDHTVFVGAFRPGQRIAEKPLATRLGVSRGPIRDALDDVVRNVAHARHSRHGRRRHPVAGRPRCRSRHAENREDVFRLSLQLRMFVSILGLEYAYSVDEIVADDTAIFHALEAHESEEVTLLWRRKIDNAVTYMVEQLGHLDVNASRRAPESSHWK
ncbi:hypothetical protein OPAG_02255 [Rhodococcus opacus PD630]|uniref:GntR family transcriptional regulator n=1 Tax=Rhodococcus opacus TaxID=37919 RepID=UPI00029CD2A7|nr:GntR family transcriptional regulator [Rhodococcus opacus]AHK29038.1 hypothetical protein Pd630_LPD01809 [Rhodococcus opacus PD630]EHI43910.1 hypothetical protein OPAG_02255 [Rhodococcus opacus PD630]UDG98864.1 GntR family transcriptional regulator [Rhodococcus opacus PD630]